jgi:putative FmdB family regulatory protein
LPIYEYECVQCGQRIERLQRFDDPAPAACESCGAAMRRLISAPAFQFKGTGWYATDYAGRGSGDKDASSGDGAEGGSKSDKAADKGADKPAEKPAEKGVKDKAPVAASASATSTGD